MRPPSPRITVACLLVATLWLGGWIAQPAAAGDATWTLEPADNGFGAGRQDYRYTINPGGRAEDGLVVVNHGTSPLELELRPAPMSPGGGEWVQLDREDATIAPGEPVEVPFTLTLPGDAGPGDYLGGIVTSGAGQRLDIPIRLRVGGALEPSLAVERVRVNYADTANPLGKGDATVTYTIHNTGNATLTARQSVSLSGPFGSWSVAAGKIADAPALLPGDTFTASVPVRAVTPAVRLQATITLIPLLTDAAGSTAPLAAVEGSGHAWAIPWSLLFIVLVVGGLLGLVHGLELDRHAARRRRAFAELDDDDSGHDQRAAGELQGARELIEEQPGERHAGDHLEQGDEGGQARAEAAAGGDSGAIGDAGGDHPEPEQRHPPCDGAVRVDG
jgi:uncharacterized membrane protein